MHHPPREARTLARFLDALLVKMGRTACWLSHAAGRRQASLGTPVPRTPTVAPGPKVRSGMASRRSQGSSSEHRGPPKPAASVDTWRLIGRGRLRFPMLPRQLLDLIKRLAQAALAFVSSSLPRSRSPFLLLATATSRSAPFLLCICRPWRHARSRLPRLRLGTSPLLRRPLSRRRALPPCAC